MPTLSAQPFRPVLVIEDRKAKRIIPLEEKTYSLGRGVDNAIVIYDRQVSRQHATLLRIADYQHNRHSYRIVDGDLQGNQSANGITVNGVACRSHELQHGDLISFGSSAQASYQILEEITEACAEGELSNQELDEAADQQTLIGPQVRQSEAELRLASVAELCPTPIIEIDSDGNATYRNPAAIAQFTQPDSSLFKGLLDREHRSHFVREVTVKDSIYKQHVHYLNQGKRIRSYLFDVTSSKQLQSALEQSRSRYQAVIQQTSEGIFFVDAVSQRLVDANLVCCRLLGYEMPALLEQTLATLTAAAPVTTDRKLQQIRAQRDFIGEALYRSQDGSLIHMEESARLISNGDVDLFCFVIRDVNKHQQLALSLHQRSLQDLLTNLPSRTIFNEQLAVALANAERHQQLMAVMFIDLDGFKKVNETCGHLVGDCLLQGFAERLKSCIRLGDTLARWGGDQFAVLLPQITSIKDTAKIGHRFLEAIAQPFDVEQHHITLQTSIGIAIYPQDGEEANTLLNHADAALHRAKKQGQNTYRFYSPTMNSKASALLRLESMLSRALAEKQFSLSYQPQVNINTGQLSGMEALLRWYHPELGQVSPSKFITLAEETNLIIPLGQWVLETACAQNKAWQEAGLPLVKVAVNLSPRQFQSNLLALVSQTLQQTELDPQWLELEIAETNLAQNPDLAMNNLRKLHDLGVCIAIDDFGSGNSSINYLKKISLQTLKIDCPFIQNLRDTPEDMAILSAIISLGRGFNLRVVAEGVETRQQFELLHRLQCEEMQGYRFSRPLKAEEATQFLAAHQFNKA
ncbi:MAG: EAL domain-containing protein [Cyanophyceae cyanobacterium]